MGSIIYDFLNDSLLFQASLQEENYASIPETRLKKELKKYRQHALDNLKVLETEIIKLDSHLKLFGDRNYFSDQSLMQTALYLDQIVLPDPIFPYTIDRSDASSTMNQFLGMPTNEGIDRKSLSVVTQQMKRQAPMIAANYLKYYPTSYYLEPSDRIPVTYSENGFSDVLPPTILDYYRENSNVKSLRKTSTGWIVENSLRVGRGIAVNFRYDNDSNMRIYNLFDQKVISMDDDTRIVKFAFSLPDEPPPVDEFNSWVNQSVNQSARGHYDQLFKGLTLSSKLGASYLTGSKFTQNLLGSKGPEQSISDFISNCVLNIDLPFLDKISMNDLMSVREGDGEAFELFRKELETKFRELRLEADPDNFKIKIQNIVHELRDVQITKIDQKFKELRKGALSNTVIAVGGLAGSVVTSGWSIAATIIALANGYKTYSDFKVKVKENPSYFLWKARNV